MVFQSQTRRLPGALAVGAALALTLAGNPAHAQAREVPAESLIYDLKNPDPVRRQSAVHQLGIAKYVAATPDLVALAGDSSPSVRREVELSLEQMEDVRALPGFVQLTADSEKDIRDRAVDALVNIHLPRATGPTAILTKLKSFVDHRSIEHLDTIVEPDVPVDPSVVQALRARLSDSEIRIRRSAARGLGILRADAGIPELVAAVREDRDNDVRFEAVRALRKIGDASVGESIMPMVDFNNDKVRNEIVATVGYLRYRRAVAALTRVFEQSKPADQSRSVALSALADIADPSSKAVFQSFKADKDETIRLYANEGLARLGDSTMKTEMSGDRLTEKSSRVQTAQAFGLLRMGQVEYLDELVRGLGSSATRDVAKEYLLETPAAQRPALFAARAEKGGARAELAEVYGLIGDRAALPALEELAGDSDSGVARAAKQAIRRVEFGARGE